MTSKGSLTDHRCTEPNTGVSLVIRQVSIPSLHSELPLLELYIDFRARGRSNFALKRSFLGSFGSVQSRYGPNKGLEHLCPYSQSIDC